MTGSIRFAAHRGLHDDERGIRENTIGAVQAAIDSRADLIEVDVRQTRDGATVILHDPDMLRVWGDPRRIDAVTVQDLRIHAGDDQMRVPLLSEVLKTVRGTGSRLLIDMDDERFAAPALAIVAEQRMGGEVEWCGDIDGMRTIRAQDPNATIWMPWSHALPPSPSDVADLRPQVLNVPCLVAGPELVEGVHALGMTLSCWTVDDELLARHAAYIGVDEITTNHLIEIRHAIRSADAVHEHEESQEESDSRALVVARHVAQSAAETIRESADDYRRHIHGKATPADLVTDLDKHIEMQVREVLRAQFPDIPVVGEEMGGEEPDSGDCWFLDPLDGSINYANGLPWFSFSLALVRSGRDPIVAAVIDPAGWRVITAKVGEGAWVEDSRVTIRPDALDNDDDPLRGAVVSAELANNAAWPGLGGIFRRLSERYCMLRIPGSGTASVMGVALGRGVATIIGRFGPLDHFAAVLIVHEAGGVIMDMAGRETLNPRGMGFLAARDRRCARAVVKVWRESVNEPA